MRPLPRINIAPLKRLAHQVRSVRLPRLTLPKRRPKPRIMKPYVDLSAWWRKIVLVATPLGLALFCLVYGFFFALTAPYLILVFAAPIALLVLLSIWALPDRPHAPTKTMELMFAAFIVCLILWPNYLALALPGLPWITAIRLTGIPMAVLFLVSLSISRSFRAEVKEVALAVPTLWVWFASFVLIQVITIPVAKYVGAGIQKFVIQQINWTIVALIAAWIVRRRGRAERYVMLTMSLSLPVLLISAAEYIEKHVLWAGYVPSFLKIDDPIVAASVFSSIFRSATGEYRAKAVFSTPLGLAEYLSLLTPFFVHFSIGKYNKAIRYWSFLMIPIIFYGIRLTDARLGVIGFLVSSLLYLLFWGMMRFRRNRRDLLGATMIYAYPAVFVAAVLAVTTIHSVKTLVFGGGAEAASNEARMHQLSMGVPKVLMNPLGHGGGGGGAAMGYGAGQFVAIDNYYLAIALDYGVIGLATFVGVFLLTITWSVRAALATVDTKDRELTLLVPLAVSMSAFLVIKIVFSQMDLHPMLFMMLGMSAALVQRARTESHARLSRARPEAKPRRPRLLSMLDDDEDSEHETLDVAEDQPALVRLGKRRRVLTSGPDQTQVGRPRSFFKPARHPSKA